MQSLDFSTVVDRPRDVITAEERAAIDAFPEDLVQVLPTGRQAIDEASPSKTMAYWREYYRRIEMRGARFRNAAVNAGIRRLAMQGLSDQQIADEVGMSQQGVNQRRKRYGIPSGRDVLASGEVA